MTYLFLALAIVFEVLGTFFIKQSQGFTRLVPSLIMFVYYGLSFSSLTLAAKKMDVSVAYPVWTGSAIALVAVMGMVYFKEPSSELKVISITLISFGVIGLALGHKAYN